jgi:ubiquinone/menaquinone biosynthesis C-methylase UbiE
MEDQQEVWDKIAEEWTEFKKNPPIHATEFLNKSQGKTLDFGSGSGRMLLKLKRSENRQLYLLDFSKEMLKLAKKRAEESRIKVVLIESRLEKTPFENNFFDAAICIAVIQCIETPKKRLDAIKELYRILKPNAEAMIEVWNRNSPRFKGKSKEKFIRWRDKGVRYYYLYDEEEIHDLFKKIGFKIIKKIPDKEKIIFVVKKPI